MIGAINEFLRFDFHLLIKPCVPKIRDFKIKLFINKNIFQLNIKMHNPPLIMRILHRPHKLPNERPTNRLRKHLPLGDIKQIPLLNELHNRHGT
jgi:hypothetical protein